MFASLNFVVLFSSLLGTGCNLAQDSDIGAQCWEQLIPQIPSSIVRLGIQRWIAKLHRVNVEYEAADAAIWIVQSDFGVIVRRQWDVSPADLDLGYEFHVCFSTLIKDYPLHLRSFALGIGVNLRIEPGKQAIDHLFPGGEGEFVSLGLFSPCPAKRPDLFWETIPPRCFIDQWLTRERGTYAGVAVVLISSRDNFLVTFLVFYHRGVKIASKID